MLKRFLVTSFLIALLGLSSCEQRVTVSLEMSENNGSSTICYTGFYTIPQSVANQSEERWREYIQENGIEPTEKKSVLC